MCGFVASFGFNFKENNFKKALKHLSRRGPDSEGKWSENKVFLGSRRLAIIDLKKRANQPMHSLCSRYVLVFNGVIYNFLELRDYLLAKGIKLRTYSDTEVILELFALEAEKMLPKLKGMFAFVIWDRVKKKAFAARDPYGIKPLYIGTCKYGLIIASQVKTLLSTNLISKEYDIDSKSLFRILGFVIEPDTWFKNIKSLNAGNYIWIEKGAIISDIKWHNINKYWDNISLSNKKYSKEKVYKEVKKSVVESVKRHLVSDVPLGLFLSSGIDSAVLAGLIVENGHKSITGITVSFNDFENTENNEVEGAKVIAKHFGIKHYVYNVSKRDFINDLPNILLAMDQPSIDGINTWYASKAASKLGLKVVFSGVGGDEIFFGYKLFKQIPILIKFISIISKIPGVVKLINVFLILISYLKNNAKWRFILIWAKTVNGAWLLKRSILTSRNSFFLKKNNTNLENLNNNFFYKKIFSVLSKKPNNNIRLKLAQMESVIYLRNQLLRDSDWASMYHGIELRTPFVDVTLLNNLKNIFCYFPFFNSKAPLINCLTKKDLPKSITIKKKIGFETPIKQWIRQLNKKRFKSLGWNDWMKTVSGIY
jgi:asparagine synthase (glutamine-hydrolysing)